MELLQERLSEMMLDRTRRVNLRLPQSEFGLMNLIHEQGKILKQEYDGNDVLVEFPPTFRVQADDAVYICGSAAAVGRFRDAFRRA